MSIRSCKDCPDRTVRCHIDCESYIEAKAEHDKIQQLIKDDQELDHYKSDKRFLARSKMLRKYGKSNT